MLLDRLIGVVAPFDCLVCSREGRLVCADCMGSVINPKAPTCFMCNKLSKGWRTCASCNRKTKIRGVIIASRYEGSVKELIKRLKYHQAASAAGVIAELVAPKVNTSEFDIITSVPASTRRQRQRGYNQAELIAKFLSRQLKLPYKRALGKLGHQRQVGTKRGQRLEQVKGTVYVLNSKKVADKRVLVVDDVVTTGATISECARVLKAAGAKSIWGLAVAKH